MRLLFTPSGRDDFLDIIDYIRRDRPMAAERFRQRAEKILSRLESFPESGRRIPEFPDLPHREVIVRPYRFFYRIAGETVWIVAVWHGAQIPIFGPLPDPPESR
ncbi:MAG TPA: type II toxin-antitoxin system RelE/ParE family toxin [Thermoanaerobaculia bacterium]|jgi:plasmid stabilization system protein ParE